MCRTMVPRTVEVRGATSYGTVDGTAGTRNAPYAIRRSMYGGKLTGMYRRRARKGAEQPTSERPPATAV